AATLAPPPGNSQGNNHDQDKVVLLLGGISCLLCAGASPPGPNFWKRQPSSKPGCSHRSIEVSRRPQSSWRCRGAELQRASWPGGLQCQSHLSSSRSSAAKVWHWPSLPQSDGRNVCDL